MGLDSKVIYINISPETVRERWLNNKNAEERFDLPEDVFEEALKEFEVPTEDENLLIYDQSIPIDDWIQSNLLEQN